MSTLSFFSSEMRAFSSWTHGTFIGAVQNRSVSLMYLSRVGLALMLAILLLGAVVLGSYVSILRDAAARNTEPPAPTLTVAAAPPLLTLPAADVAGEDFATLPRYPGSIRSAYDVYRDDRFQLNVAEYLVAATVGDVRVFYQTVIEQYGWERVDIDYSDGEWAYLILNGADEALIEIEERDGLVEIDLQFSHPIGDQAPTLPDALPLPPAPPPAAPPPAAPAPPDDDDADDDWSEDDSDD